MAPIAIKVRQLAVLICHSLPAAGTPISYDSGGRGTGLADPPGRLRPGRYRHHHRLAPGEHAVGFPGVRRDSVDNVRLYARWPALRRSPGVPAPRLVQHRHGLSLAAILHLRCLFSNQRPFSADPGSRWSTRPGRTWEPYSARRPGSAGGDRGGTRRPQPGRTASRSRLAFTAGRRRTRPFTTFRPARPCWPDDSDHAPTAQHPFLVVLVNAVA